MESNFIDHVRLRVRSGQGGPGKVYLHRDRFTTKGGPQGGDGGRGGHVVLRANPQEWTLLHLKYRKNVLAPNGEGGGKTRLTGAEGDDQILEAPLGTVAYDANTGERLGELTEAGQELVLARGGRGGLGNWHFKSSTHQTPRYAQAGEPGEERWLVLELKLLADVGLVGFPNAGKSTLLASVSAARPEVADYPFTTLTPKLGIVAVDEARSFAMADIPGLIEGAHQGRGLGTRFLRHIERNAVLLFVLSCETDDLAAAYRTLLHELLAHNPELGLKRRALAISKCDLLDEELIAGLRAEWQAQRPDDVPVYFISGVSGYGLTDLKRGLLELVGESKDQDLLQGKR